MQGIPGPTTDFAGIDRMGEGCRVASSVTVYRRAEVHPSPERGIRLGDGVGLYEGVRLVLGDPWACPDAGISLGDGVIVNAFSYLSGEGGLVVEQGVLFGPQTCILSAGHEIDDGHDDISANALTYAPIRIRRGAWIGAAATVLQGVTVGRGAVVAAGSVVTRDVPDFAVVAGVPAQVIRYRHGHGPGRSPGLLGRWLRRLQGRGGRR